jgi:lipopolysaccharide transport system permease protein
LLSAVSTTPESHFDGERVTVIRPTRGWAALNLRELWDYRELLYFLIWRDVKIKYKQTAIGVVWVVLQPLLVAIIFTVIFGHFAKFKTFGPPYLLFTYSAMLPWLLFQNGITLSTKSIVENQALVTKVYVPRLLIPIAPVLGGVVDFLVGSVVLVALFVYYSLRGALHGAFTLHLLTLPFFLLFAVVAAVAVTLWLSALNVRYRDVQYTVPFLAQAWFFATPVLYSASLIPLDLRPWIGLNPMAGVVQGFRWALFGSNIAQVGHIMLLSFGVTTVLLIGGIEYFRRVERSFADVV